jgi:hypothetical protein
MLGRIILGLALVVASTYLARVTGSLSQPSGRRRDSKTAGRFKTSAADRLSGLRAFARHPILFDAYRRRSWRP